VDTSTKFFVVWNSFGWIFFASLYSEPQRITCQVPRELMSRARCILDSRGLRGEEDVVARGSSRCGDRDPSTAPRLASLLAALLRMTVPNRHEEWDTSVSVITAEISNPEQTYKTTAGGHQCFETPVFASRARSLL
jgi:hypothetical protein